MLLAAMVLPLKMHDVQLQTNANIYWHIYLYIKPLITIKSIRASDGTHACIGGEICGLISNHTKK